MAPAMSGVRVTVGELRGLLGRYHPGMVVVLEASEAEQGYVGLSVESEYIVSCEREGHWDGDWRPRGFDRGAVSEAAVVLLRALVVHQFGFECPRWLPGVYAARHP